jgi:hypothetical protein
LASWTTNPGRSANNYHKYFSKIIKQNTLNQIEEAQSKGAKLICHSGFHARNVFVADSEYLIAFSFADGDEPTSGGTLDTWTKCRAKHKIHISLNTLAVNDPSSFPTQANKRKPLSSRKSFLHLFTQKRPKNLFL